MNEKDKRPAAASQPSAWPHKDCDQYPQGCRLCQRFDFCPNGAGLKCKSPCPVMEAMGINRAEACKACKLSARPDGWG